MIKDAENSTSEPRLRLIFDNAPVGIIQLDEDRRYIFANAAFQRFVGYSFEELKGTTMFALTHPEDLPVTRKMSEGFSLPGFWIRRLEKRYVHKNGHTVWGLVTSQQLLDPVTGTQHLLTVIEDITELKKREFELRRAEAEIDHYFSVALELIAVFGIDTNIIKVNPAFCVAFGYEPSEVEGRSVFDFIHPEDAENSIVQLQGLAQGIPSLKFENRCRTKSGTYRLVSWNSAPDHERKIFYAAGRDITDKKIDELKMTYSAKMASLGEMAGGIAHEVNNPLAIILGKVTNLQLLIDDPEVPKELVREELSSIERTGLRIAKIIRGLRAFSRHGDADPMNRIPLGRVIEETLELCAERLKSRNIELRITGEGNTVVSCRPTELSQV
ncbi:MAG: PAS domain S-box protein, partial [Bdellovibrionota bacterium]